MDINNKTTHTDALFGYSYSVAIPHFISNHSLGVDSTLRNCYQSFSVSFKLQNCNTIHCNSLIEGASNKHSDVWNCQYSRNKHIPYILTITDFSLDAIHLHMATTASNCDVTAIKNNCFHGSLHETCLCLILRFLFGISFGNALLFIKTKR